MLSGNREEEDGRGWPEYRIGFGRDDEVYVYMPYLFIYLLVYNVLSMLYLVIFCLCYTIATTRFFLISA